MARFDGTAQGVAVWLRTLLITVVLAVLAAAAGQKYHVSATLNIFPRIPVNEGTLTTAGIMALISCRGRRPDWRDDPTATPTFDHPTATPTV